MFELSGVNYEEVLEQGIQFNLSYREFELSGIRVIGIILYLYTYRMFHFSSFLSIS